MPTNNSWNSPLPVPVSNGGTGNSTQTSNAVVIGNTGDSPFQFVSPGSAGTLLISNGPSSAPSFQGIGPTLVNFAAYITTTVLNVTGDGTPYTMVYNNELYDVGSNYDNTTGVFTASVTGLYSFSGSMHFTVNVGGFVGTSVEGRSVDTNNEYYLFEFTGSDIPWSNSISQNFKTVIPLTAGDTVTWVAQAGGGPKNVSMTGSVGGVRNFISGYLIF